MEDSRIYIYTHTYCVGSKWSHVYGHNLVDNRKHNQRIRLQMYLSTNMNDKSQRSCKTVLYTKYVMQRFTASKINAVCVFNASYPPIN
jgi:hypothetical protein